MLDPKDEGNAVLQNFGTTHPHPMTPSQVLGDGHPTAKVIKSTEAQKLYISIPYPSPTMEVTFLNAPTVAQAMVDVQWSTKGLHNCAHTHQNLCCMFFY